MLRTRLIAGTAIISEKAMCMLGTAAYGLTRTLLNEESCFMFVNTAIVSGEPRAREHRGGAVGNSA